VVSSPRYSSGLVEVERDWTVVDVVIANDVLDVYEEAEALARQPK
jgi:hypothetical protein